MKTLTYKPGNWSKRPSKAELVIAYKVYVTSERVAEHFGVTSRTVTNWLRSFKLSLGKRSLPPPAVPRHGKVYEFLADHAMQPLLSNAKLAKLSGIPRQTWVNAWCTLRREWRRWIARLPRLPGQNIILHDTRERPVNFLYVKTASVDIGPKATSIVIDYYISASYSGKIVLSQREFLELVGEDRWLREDIVETHDGLLLTLSPSALARRGARVVESP